MMVAQLELRAKRLDSAELALAASLQLQPRLRPAVLGVQKELRHWKKAAAVAPATLKWAGKDPWFLGHIAAAALKTADVLEEWLVRFAVLSPSLYLSLSFFLSSITLHMHTL